MKKITFLFILLFILLFAFSQTSFAQSDVWTHTFESSGGYSTSVVEFTDGDFDYFTRTNGSDIGTVEFTNINGSYYFAAQDTDGDSQPTNLTLTFDDIDISAFNDLIFYIYFAEDDDGTNQDWDASTYVHIDYDIDNSGSFSNLIHVEASTDALNQEPAIDTNFDGTGDGTAVTSIFSEFTKALSGTGSVIDIRVTFNNLKNGDEDIALDNLRLAGTPAGSPLISVSPSSLLNFEYINGSGPSTDQSFTISGFNLTADISIYPPTNYEISTGTGGSFAATNHITLSQSGGSVAETNIYTRLKAGLSIGNYISENIISSSIGSTSKNVICSGAVLPKLVINEIHADPDTTNGDANSDGTIDQYDDEFVEIINNEVTIQDFGGFTLSDRIGIKHTFPSPTNIPAGESIVVFGGGTPSFINGTTQVASSGSLSLNNGGDDVILKSGSIVIASYTYGSEGGDNQSLGRNPDITGDFFKHSTFAPDEVLFSPGDRNVDASPLPVELTSFTAKLKRGRVYLNWATATEVNNYGFAVEQISNLLPEWKEIGFVEGHGNSNSPKSYSFADISIISGKASYRLKQIDTNGTFEYSDVVTVTNEIVKNKLFQNHPNPFNPSTEISFSLAEAGKVNVSVYNVLGEKVAELVNQDMDEGVHKVELNANNFASGFYFYRLETSTYSKTMKMILLR